MIMPYTYKCNIKLILLFFLNAYTLGFELNIYHYKRAEITKKNNRLSSGQLAVIFCDSQCIFKRIYSHVTR